ncbi:MAG: hypothetical protein IJG07_03970 [Prevotella sp.]|nr:hypothetical protein [Prevotella sp.]
MVWMITLEKKYCEAIIDGRKKIEIRTRIPKIISPGDAILVCMKGSNGIVPFYFVVDTIGVFSPRLLWSSNHQELAIEEKDYFEYTKGKQIVYGIRIRRVFKYEHEVNISDFGIQKAPQWFKFVPCGRTDLIVGSGRGN